MISNIANSKPIITTNTLENVVERVLSLRYKAQTYPVLVLIGGCSRAGKSWLSGAVKERLIEMNVPNLIVKLDAWLIGVDERRPRSSVLERFDIVAIERDITSLLTGRPVYPPTYDARTRRRVSEASAAPLMIDKGLLIVEGVIALAIPYLRERAALKIYVKVEDSLRWNRLMSFYCDFKGLGKSEAEQILFEREAEETPFAKASEYWADLTFEGSGGE